MRRWGLFVHRNRWAVLGVCGVVFVASVIALLNGAELKNASDFNLESVRADKLSSKQLPSATGTSFLLLFTDTEHTYPDPQFQQAVVAALAQAPVMVSADRHSVDSVINLSIDFSSARQQYNQLRHEVHSSTLRISS